MNAYIFQAASLCESCAKDTQTKLDRVATEHGNVSFSYRKDSDKYPQGPYSDGGGEADTPQHCDHCGVFLENPLTGDGYAYVREQVREVLDYLPSQTESHVFSADGFDWPLIAELLITHAEQMEAQGDIAAADATRNGVLQWVRYYGPDY
jgi:hypothetical protein